MVRLTQRSTILLSDSIFVFVLATAQLTAVSSPVVQRHIPWNRKARAGGAWCEAFAPQPAESQGETPPFVSLHHGMSEAFSGGCSTSMLTLPGFTTALQKQHCNKQTKTIWARGSHSLRTSRGCVRGSRIVPPVRCFKVGFVCLFKSAPHTRRQREWGINF